MPNSKSLFRKYALIFSGLLTGAVLASGALTIGYSYQDNKKALVSLQREKAEAGAARIGQILFDIEKHIALTSVASSNLTLLDQRSMEIRLLKHTAAIHQVTLIDPAGKEYLQVTRNSADVTRSGRDWSTQEMFLHVKSGRPYRSPIFFRDGALYMTVAMAVGPEEAGITVAEIDLEFLLAGILGVKVGKSGYAYAVDAKGRLIAHPDLGLVLANTSVASLPQVATALNGSLQGNADLPEARGIDGSQVLAAFGAIPQLGWYVFVEEPLADAYRPLYGEATRSALLILVALALAVLLSLALMRRMLKPIHALQEGANRIGSGVLDHRITIRTGDEFEELANTFNGMAERLQESHRTLEQRVAERTRELSASLDQVRQQEQEIRESEGKLHAVFNVADIGVSITDQAGRYILFNSWWTKQLGYEKEELERLTNIDITHPDDVAESRLRFQEIVSGKVEQYRLEKRFVRKDKSVFWGLLSVSAIKDADGVVANVVGMVTDVTVRKQAEAELVRHRNHLEELVFARTAELAQARDEAEAANRAKSIFLATVSHELRTPMNGVMGMTDLVLRRATDPQQIDWLNKSRKSAEHLLVIINDIIDISKMEAEQLTLEESEFSLAQVIDDTLAMHDAPARAKGLKLSNEVAPDLPDLLRGDALRLRQVLISFISNAIKFSEHGRITVRVFSAEKDSHSLLLRIEVSDQGIGIGAEDQARLFQTFSQVDGSSTRKYGGAGLGLILAKRLALLMGGEVGADGTPGKGSTFWFTARMKLGHGIASSGKNFDTDGAGHRQLAPGAVPNSGSGLTPDPDRAQAVLHQLEALLATGDYMARDLFESNRPLLLATLGAEAMRLGQQIAAFDNEAALATLRKIIPG